MIDVIDDKPEGAARGVYTHERVYVSNKFVRDTDKGYIVQAPGN